MVKKYCCIHGHFYQPPRENPWTGIVERQSSAKPEHDWNRRIARECYIPNGAARILDGKGRIAELVNNYERLSFNFGPTLLSWYAEAYPRDYRLLLEADHKSASRLGHGNAIAQAYNHMILTLASPRDMNTQIHWGLEDFRRRFGREAEALWIPETACNDAVLSALAGHGLKYALLAPAQAWRVRPIGAAQWTDVSSGGLDTRRPYLWSDPAARGAKRLALFFYDAGLSHGVAFEKAMSDAKAWAGRIESAFSPAAEEPELVSLCTDGESYGHHEHFGEMGLAQLLSHELAGRHIEVVNYSHYLERHPPRWEAQIRPGADGLGTSWSCGHGAARWTDACGCGGEKCRLLWRRPMREALDWLRDRLAEVYESEGKRLFRDPWQARDDYIQVVLDRRDEALARYLAEQLRVPDAPAVRQKALRLLEMQRHAMLMYTSCGWFFSDIAGIEAVKNLQYAARAVELARMTSGANLEEGLLSRLKRAPSGDSSHKDGEAVYRKLALSAAVSEDLVAVQHAVSTFLDKEPLPWGCFEAVSSQVLRRSAAGAQLCAGRVTLRDTRTTAAFSRIFLAAFFSDGTVRVFVQHADVPSSDYDALLKRVARLSPGSSPDLPALAGPLFPHPPFSFADLPADEVERFLKIFVDKKRPSWEAPDGAECLAAVERYADLGLDLPAGLQARCEASLDARLHAQAWEFLRDPDIDLSKVACAAGRARGAGLRAPSAEAEEAWERCFVFVLGNLEKKFDSQGVKRLISLARAASKIGFHRWRFRAQSRFFALLKRLPPTIEENLIHEASQELGVRP